MTWGLLAAWLVHDAEELVMMPRWLARAGPRPARRLPGVPDQVRRHLAPSQAHTAVAIGFMGCLVTAAAYDGDRTDGRSPLFQVVLAGFGAHAVPHLGSAVLTGGYTPGLVTTPTVVVPYTIWASRRLRRAGVEQADVPAAAYALLPVTIGAAHLGARAVSALRARLRRRRQPVAAGVAS